MLIAARNGFLAGKRLPYDAEVEYLESTGTQWIDTGIVPKIGDSVRMMFKLTRQPTHSPYDQIMGAGTGTYQFCFPTGLWTNAYPGIWCRIWAGGSGYVTPHVLSTSIGPNYLTEFRVEHISGKEYRCSIGADYITPSAMSEIDGPDGDRSLLIFRRPNVGNSWIKCYAFQLWDENGVLVRDFIPVRKGTTGAMYDRVSGKLFGNAGTGDFVLGQDVVPVEWLETTGSQYIDTGVTCGSADTTVFEFDQSYSALQSGRFIWGSNYGANQGKDNDNYYVCGLDRSDVIMQPGVIYHCKTQVAPNNAVKAYINGTLFRDNTGSSPYTSPFYIFRLGGVNVPEGKPSYLRIHHLTVSINNVRVRGFQPVRVGTEGAMMDVLTRRIYRNAGTGAFIIGPDK